jgi:hypothetical protein
MSMGAPYEEQPDWLWRWNKQEGMLLYENIVYIPDGLQLEVLRISYDDPLAGHFGTK